MDKVSRIVAAALLASAFAYNVPAFAVQTTAEDFVAGLSSDFSKGDIDRAIAKLNELKRLGFEGIMFDGEMVSVDQMLALLADVQSGAVSGEQAAATLLAYLNASAGARFVMGGVLVTVADLNAGAGAGTIFPAGSAG